MQKKKYKENVTIHLLFDLVPIAGGFRCLNILKYV